MLQKMDKDAWRQWGPIQNPDDYNHDAFPGAPESAEVMARELKEWYLMQPKDYFPKKSDDPVLKDLKIKFAQCRHSRHEWRYTAMGLTAGMLINLPLNRYWKFTHLPWFAGGMIGLGADLWRDYGRCVDERQAIDHYLLQIRRQELEGHKEMLLLQWRLYSGDTSVMEELNRKRLVGDYTQQEERTIQMMNELMDEAIEGVDLENINDDERARLKLIKSIGNFPIRPVRNAPFRKKKHRKSPLMDSPAFKKRRRFGKDIPHHSPFEVGRRGQNRTLLNPANEAADDGVEYELDPSDERTVFDEYAW